MSVSLQSDLRVLHFTAVSIFDTRHSMELRKRYSFK